MEKIKGYKGFDKDMKCRGFQYESGKDYTYDGDIHCCKSGFHFCENPLEVFSYYPPATSRFCEVEGSGKVDNIDEDSKVSVSNLHIGLEIGLSGLIQAGIKFILDKVNFNGNRVSNTGARSAATNTGYYSAATNTGARSAATNTGYYSAATNTGERSAATNTGERSAATNTGARSAATNTGERSAATNTGARSAATNTGAYSAATNTGDYSAATNTGYRSAATNTGACSAATNTGYYSAATNTGACSAATNTGDYSAAEVKGKDSIAIAAGYNSKASGTIGCWLVLTERNSNYEIVDVKAVRVDGHSIKENTYYTLENGQIKEIKKYHNMKTTDNTTTSEAIRLIAVYTMVVIHNTAQAIDRSAHRHPWAYIIATIIAATIISYAAIGQARVERDSYNHQYILLQDSIARTSV